MDESRENQPSSPPPEPTGRPRRRDLVGYWKANIRLILGLLIVWTLVSHFAGILFIEQLNQFTIGQLPLGFWFAQQGAIYVFVVLILIYATAMDVIDRRYGVSEKQRDRDDSGSKT